MFLNEKFSLYDLKFKGQLLAVISHYGPTTDSGHYKAHIRTENSWYCCNDSVISLVDFDDITNSKECYLLFYIES